MHADAAAPAMSGIDGRTTLIGIVADPIDHDRDPPPHNKRAVQLAQALTRRHPALLAFPAPQIPAAYDLAINATPLGLAAAGRRGLRVHAGRHMLESQVESMGRFLGLL
jgi:shikimate 5-dehydrogenase